MESYNFTTLCGTEKFDIWSPSSHSLALCFQKLVLLIPIYALLALCSAYFTGRQAEFAVRTQNELTIIHCRMAVVVGMIVFAVVIEPLSLVLETNARVYWADVAYFGVQGLAWTVHLGYLATLRLRHVGSSLRGSSSVLVVWGLSVGCLAIMTQTCFSDASLHWDKSYRTVLRALSLAQLALQMLYFLTIIPRGEGRGTGEYRTIPRERLLQQQAVGQLGSSSGQYTRFHEIVDPYYLGTAEHNVTWLSYLFMHWVNPMLDKGSVGLLKNIDDLPLLPQDLRTQQVSYFVRRHLLLSQPLPSDEREDENVFPFIGPTGSESRESTTYRLPYAGPPSTSSTPDQEMSGSPRGKPSVRICSSTEHHDISSTISGKDFSLLRELHNMFGVQFYCLGVLKLVSDACGFAGPLLLHELVAYTDSKEVEQWKGYVFTLGLCSAALVATLCSVHFSYSLSRLNLKLRAALITAINRKVYLLSAVQGAAFTKGQVVTFIDTDVQRMLNFGQSLHSCWSLPLQLIVTLYLLYTQIGFSFFSGVLIVILVLPINRILAVKIAKLSVEMMSHKDRRVERILELLSIIRAVKMNCWEERMATAIRRERAGELKALAFRKYLDAACVYFWAATPVFIPIAVFATYILFGNTSMEAARVFTVVALLNMLVMPLNAFPWVINGLVEAYISCKRIEKLLKIKEEDMTQYYTIVSDMSATNSDVQIIIQNASFSWDSSHSHDAATDIATEGESEHRGAQSAADFNQELDDDEGDGFEGSASAARGLGPVRSSTSSSIASTTSRPLSTGMPKSKSSSMLSNSNRRKVKRKLFSTSRRIESDEEDLVDNDFNTAPPEIPEGSHFEADNDGSVEDGFSNDSVSNFRNTAEEMISDTSRSRRKSRRRGADKNHISPDSNLMALCNINLQVRRGDVVAIIGRTGSGKTTLINALLGELVRKQGILAVAGLHHGFGYAAQEPWIMDRTIRENILFGAPYEQTRYDRIVYACALHDDFVALPKGDATRCGVDGQCLSGGQKSRIALARAIYQQKGIYLLDGILSSVDAPVARHIMKEVVHGFLQGRTVLITTHHVHLTTQCNLVVRLHRGRITHSGPPDEVLPEFLSTQELSRDVLADTYGLFCGGSSWVRKGAMPSSSGAVPKAIPLPGNSTCGGLIADSPASATGTPPHRGGDGEALLLLEDHQKYALLTADAEEDAPDPSFLSSINREHQEIGSLSWRVYRRYLSSIGYWLVIFTLIALIGMQGSRNFTDLWLAKWVNYANGATNATLDVTPSSERLAVAVTSQSPVSIHSQTLSEQVVAFASWQVHPNIHRHSLAYPFSWTASMGSLIPEPPRLLSSYLDNVQAGASSTSIFFLQIYCLIALGHTVFTILRAFGFAYCGIKAARVLHDKLLNSIMGASVGFFENNPIGRILNRFSSDVYAVDDALPFQLNIFCAQICGLLGSVIVTVCGLPWMLLLYVPVSIVYHHVQQYYRFTSRDLRRLYAVSLSPLYAHFSQALSGLSTIRALRAVNTFSSECEQLLEASQRAWLALQATAQWLNLRLQLMGVIVLAGVCSLALLQHHTAAISPGIVGLVISYALTINGFLNGVVSSYAETERELVAVERIDQYIVGSSVSPDGRTHGSVAAANSLVSYGESDPAVYDDFEYSTEYQNRENSSAGGEESGLSPGPSWPQHNTIRFDGLYLRYNFHNPYALKNLSFRIGANEKVGILGRTGAGKSSIFASLFRLVEPCRGAIFIDNVDISGLQLHRLRSAMAVVPQCSPLFSGTVRENLDPFSKNTDTRIWQALRACYVDTTLVTAVKKAHRLRQEVEQGQKRQEDGETVEERPGHRRGKHKSGCHTSRSRHRSRRPVDTVVQVEDACEEFRLQCLDSEMKDVGRILSAGERQLLVLARALLTKAKIVCVDEGTAQLDPISEELVYRTLQDAFRNTTLLIIAHRLRTLNYCDRLLVMDNGELVEEGSPHELKVKTDSLYSQLLRRQ